jgi:hypothetical protein
MLREALSLEKENISRARGEENVEVKKLSWSASPQVFEESSVARFSMTPVEFHKTDQFRLVLHGRVEDMMGIAGQSLLILVMPVASIS